MYTDLQGNLIKFVEEKLKDVIHQKEKNPSVGKRFGSKAGKRERRGMSKDLKNKQTTTFSTTNRNQKKGKP